MAKLKDFPPPIEPAQVAAREWDCAPVGMTAQSDALTRANFDGLCDMLDAVDPGTSEHGGKDWEILSFKHFDTKWSDHIFVRPGSECALVCDGARGLLSSYPCLDEDLWVEYEADDEAYKEVSENADTSKVA